ncbi:hypothetical protein ACHAXA_006710 [Cyclostephanos tholiformis]|uniref:Glycosyl transferase CAP10 domain-containing protein n=1 Tax=Cyclostephanos tholiformis TaxID=382380 RepID=A0ABD3SS16_9STRA
MTTLILLNNISPTLRRPPPHPPSSTDLEGARMIHSQKTSTMHDDDDDDDVNSDENYNGLVISSSSAGGRRGGGGGIGTMVLREIFSTGNNDAARSSSSSSSRRRRRRRKLMTLLLPVMTSSLCLAPAVILISNDDDAKSSLERKMRKMRRASSSSSSSSSSNADVLFAANVRSSRIKADNDEDGGGRRRVGMAVDAHDGGYDDDIIRPKTNWLSMISRVVLNGAWRHESRYPIPDDIDEPLRRLFDPIESMMTSNRVPPYSLADVVHAVPHFRDNLAVIVYDPRDDVFVMHYPIGMTWTKGCKKLVTSFEILANSLRIMFPERFDPTATPVVPELAMAISSGDYPSLHWNECMRSGDRDCDDGDDDVGGSSPSTVLHFGSVFRSSALLPVTMLPMPMPQWNHLHCFHYWTLHRKICPYYLPRDTDNSDGLMNADILGLRYDDLIPQVIWRGSDFTYLGRFHPELRRPDFDADIAARIDATSSSSSRVSATTRSAAVDAILDIYDELLPRWKGVALTAEAERDAERHNNKDDKIAQGTLARGGGGVTLPWCNMKFSSIAKTSGPNTPPVEVEYRRFVEYGIPAAGEAMDIETLGTYRYHIDIGGGGGTTWSGTLEKLGLPGVLFHHVTPTMDYIHDLLTPWVHYIPVEADLRDLREKYEWAEAHPRHAERISAAATALVMSLGTPDGFGAMHRKYYEEPLRRVMESYRPLSVDGIDWREALPGMGGDGLRPILQCGGYYHHDCTRLLDKKYLTHNTIMGTEGMEVDGG